MTADDEKTPREEGLEIERAKLEIEQKKLRLQRWQPIVAPILAVLTFLLGVGVAVKGNLDAARRADAAQAAQALAETGNLICEDPFIDLVQAFSGLAGESLTGDGGTPSPGGEGEGLASLCKTYLELPPGVAVQRELIQQLVDHPDQRDQILAMWRAIYTSDAWIDGIEAALDTSGG